MAYNHVHPWLNELRFSGVRAHVDALRALPDVDTLYPGHGAPMSKPQLDEYVAYVDEFLAVAATAPDAKTIIDAMSTKHPDYVTPAGLRFSAAAYVEAAAGEGQAEATP